MHAWYMPIPSTGRARLAVSAAVLSATLKAAAHRQHQSHSGIQLLRPLAGRSGPSQATAVRAPLVSDCPDYSIL